MEDIEIYSYGLVYLCCCVKKGKTKEEIEEYINNTHPTGISSQWKIRDTHFKYGARTNPCQCETHEDRQHYQLSC